MSAFKIGGFSFRSANDISRAKKAESKSDEQAAAPCQSKTDSVELCPNRLSVMPRMNTIGGKSMQHMHGETVESLLKDSAAELDAFFSKAYGFNQDAE